MINKLSADFIQGLSLQITIIHRVGIFLRSFCGSYMPAIISYSMFFASLFNFSEFETIKSLTFFNPEIWKKNFNASDRLLIGYLPRIKMFSVFVRWFRHIKSSTEMFFQKFRNCGRHLSQSQPFAIGGAGRIFRNSHGICRFFNPDRSIAINRSS